MSGVIFLISYNNISANINTNNTAKSIIKMYKCVFNRAGISLNKSKYIIIIAYFHMRIQQVIIGECGEKPLSVYVDIVFGCTYTLFYHYITGFNNECAIGSGGLVDFIIIT